MWYDKATMSGLLYRIVVLTHNEYDGIVAAYIALYIASHR